MVNHRSIIFLYVGNTPSTPWDNVNHELQRNSGLIQSTDLIITFKHNIKGEYTYNILKNEITYVLGETSDINVVSELLRKAYGVKPDQPQPEIRHISGQRFG